MEISNCLGLQLYAKWKLLFVLSYIFKKKEIRQQRRRRERESSPGAEMLRRPRGSCSGGFWTGSKCFWPVWQRWDFLWRPGPLSASTLERRQEGSQTLSCGLSRNKTRSMNTFSEVTTLRFQTLVAEFLWHWPVWFVPRRVLRQRIPNEMWPPRDRQHLITVADKKRE